jgi:hypothetical protein
MNTVPVDGSSNVFKRAFAALGYNRSAGSMMTTLCPPKWDDSSMNSRNSRTFSTLITREAVGDPAAADPSAGCSSAELASNTRKSGCDPARNSLQDWHAPHG